LAQAILAQAVLSSRALRLVRFARASIFPALCPAMMLLCFSALMMLPVHAGPSEFLGKPAANESGSTEPSEPSSRGYPSANLSETTNVELPDETTGYDVPGPYLEEPSDDEAEHPQPAKKDWEKNTSRVQMTPYNTWGRSFCESHNVGYFCDGFSRVRCCRNTWGFVKCGTTVHSTTCGYRGGGYQIHPGWRPSSFCRSHHTGFFCYQHRRVQCCNDYGHFVDCSTSSSTNWRC